MFRLKEMQGSWPYPAPPMRVAYSLQEPLREELDQLQKQQIIVTQGVDETLEWCNSLLLVNKANGKVSLCLDPIRPVHRDPTLNDILLILADIKYLTLIDVSPGYHNLKSDEQSSHSITFHCPFGRYRYIQLPFGVAPAADIFQKMDKLFVLCIADDILIAGLMNEVEHKVLRICRWVNLNRDKCLFKCSSIPSFSEITSWQGVNPDPRKGQVLMYVQPPKSRRKLVIFGCAQFP